MAPGQNQRRQDRRGKHQDQATPVPTPAPAQAAVSQPPSPPPPPAVSTTSASSSMSTSEPVLPTIVISKPPRPTKSVTETLTLSPSATTTSMMSAEEHQNQMKQQSNSRGTSNALLIAIPIICVLILCSVGLGLILFLRRRKDSRRRRGRESTSTTSTDDTEEGISRRRSRRSRRYQGEPKRVSSKSTLGSSTLASHLSYSPKQPVVQEEMGMARESQPYAQNHGVAGHNGARPMSGASSVYPDDYHHHIQQIHQVAMPELGDASLRHQPLGQAAIPIPPDRSLAREQLGRSPKIGQDTGSQEVQRPFGGMLPLRSYSPPLSPPPQRNLPTRPTRFDQQEHQPQTQENVAARSWIPAPLRFGGRRAEAGPAF